MDEIKELRFSDHSPISCTFRINIPDYCDIRRLIISKDENIRAYGAIIRISDVEIYS